ncbi:hypothetical protein JTE90_018447 [Oedothorax gibbosus]|uniref:Uncharacterized protein n=1 Tax=Oedothorax gibbosus TaxID=931172 RepID=A0AAV6V079_9ARAC|nr:hypothetical protein JTE90_018447 [Oedothorax gibbosus]
MISSPYQAHSDPHYPLPFITTKLCSHIGKKRKMAAHCESGVQLSRRLSMRKQLQGTGHLDGIVDTRDNIKECLEDEDGRSE